MTDINEAPQEEVTVLNEQPYRVEAESVERVLRVVFELHYAQVRKNLDLEALLKGAHSDIEHLSTEYTNAWSEYEKLKAVNDELSRDVRRLDSEKQLLVDQLKICQQARHNTMQDNDDKDEHINDLLASNTALDEAVEASKELIKGLSDKLLTSEEKLRVARLSIDGHWEIEWHMLDKLNEVRVDYGIGIDYTTVTAYAFEHKIGPYSVDYPTTDRLHDEEQAQEEINNDSV